MPKLNVLFETLNIHFGNKHFFNKILNAREIFASLASKIYKSIITYTPVGVPSNISGVYEMQHALYFDVVQT